LAILEELASNLWPVTSVHADAPPEEPKDEDDGSKKEEKEDGESTEEDDKEEAGDKEEEEEDDEPVDPMPGIQEECKKGPCHELAHHYDQCVERVTSGKADKDEDCVEEFLHMTHCVADCTAPKLFKQLI